MRRLFILRPQPGADSSVRTARQMGLDVESLPLFVIEPVAWDPPDPRRFDALIVTSANAMRSGGDGLGTLARLPVYAVGEATAEAARGQGFTVAMVGQGDVDDLLGAIPASLRCLHLCGADRKAPRDASRIAAAVPVYRSRAVPVDGIAETLAGSVAAAHSPRAAARLADLVTPPLRAKIRIAAISEAAGAAAGTGWEHCAIAERPRDSALLALAARLCEG